VVLAPLAIQAAEGMGMGATYLASNAAAPAGQGADPAERRERCGELEDAAPSVIELRQMDGGGAIQWRELRVDDSAHVPVWAVGAAPGSDTAWRPAENLLKMNFAPPLTPTFKPGKSTYLVYAPAEPQTSVEDDQLTSLTGEFGAASGTFQWNGRAYQYSMAHQLPCFHAPTATN
ncbi:MAG: hypothetical protein ACREQC_14650, partial [Candidatus Binataceae bacterium]